MKKVLILFAHPRFEQSRIHSSLIKAVPIHPNVTFRDLYELYPDFNVDINAEQKLLTEHDVVIWQHPFYWYSAPPLLKQWMDMVLEYGWAYGSGGNALTGKWVFNVLSSGGPREVYHPTGRNRYTVGEFLRPFEQTARLCSMEWLQPFVVQGTHRLDDQGIATITSQYSLLLELLVAGEPLPTLLAGHEFINDYLSTLHPSSL